MQFLIIPESNETAALFFETVEMDIQVPDRHFLRLRDVRDVCKSALIPWLKETKQHALIVVAQGANVDFACHLTDQHAWMFQALIAYDAPDTVSFDVVRKRGLPVLKTTAAWRGTSMALDSTASFLRTSLIFYSMRNRFPNNLTVFEFMRLIDK